MKSMVGGTILAVVLFLVAAACWSEAQVTRRVADAHRRLATLHYDSGGRYRRCRNRLQPAPVARRRGTLRDQTSSRHSVLLAGALRLAHRNPDGDRAAGGRRSVAPARRRQRSLPRQRAAGRRSQGRRRAPRRRRSAIRRRPPQGSEQRRCRLQLRVRRRGCATRSPRLRRKVRRETRSREKAELVSVDLPAGPTIHGRPGAPPEGTPMSDFKTVTPMRYDEREEQMDPGRGKEIQRKG